MPTYEYRCKSCNHQFDAVQSFTDQALTECPECGGALKKVFGSVGITFKGSGFYKTDSRAGGSSGDREKVPAGKDGGGKDGGGKDGGDKASSDGGSGGTANGAGSSDKAGSASKDGASTPAKKTSTTTSSDTSSSKRDTTASGSHAKR